MEIKYSANFFRIKGKEITLALGFPLKRTEADILVSAISVPREKVVSKVRKETFTVFKPGEYEVSGVDIKTIGGNCWFISLENWRFYFFTNGWTMPSEKKLEKLGKIDILFVSVDGTTENAKKTAEAAKKISPSFVIPGLTNNEEKDAANLVKPFLDETDSEDTVPAEGLILKKREDLPEETKIILLR